MSKEDKIKNYYKNQYKKKIINQKINSYYKEKYKIDNTINNYYDMRKMDIMVQITDNLNRRMCTKLKKRSILREFKYNDLLGCSLEDFKSYLQYKFKEGMNFDNYGEWEIDHIKPISSFDLSLEDDIKKCCHYTNLQPLWRFDNRSKHNKIM